MEKEAKEIWENIVLDLTKIWILEHKDFQAVNCLAKNYIAVKPKIDVDAHIEFKVYDIFDKCLGCFTNICSFNEPENVSEVMQTFDDLPTSFESEDNYNAYISSVLLKKNNVYILPKATTVNFIPNTVDILYDVKLGSFKEQESIRQYCINKLMLADSLESKMYCPSIRKAASGNAHYEYPGF